MTPWTVGSINFAPIAGGSLFYESSVEYSLPGTGDIALPLLGPDDRIWFCSGPFGPNSADLHAMDQDTGVFTTYSIAGAHDIVGIGSDGTNLWVADSRFNDMTFFEVIQVATVDTSGSIVSAFTETGIGDDVFWGGDYLLKVGTTMLAVLQNNDTSTGPSYIAAYDLSSPTSAPTISTYSGAQFSNLTALSPTDLFILDPISSGADRGRVFDRIDLATMARSSVYGPAGAGVTPSSIFTTGFKSMFFFDGLVWFTGVAFVPTTVIWTYDPVGNTWTDQTTSFPSPTGEPSGLTESRVGCVGPDSEAWIVGYLGSLVWRTTDDRQWEYNLGINNDEIGLTAVCQGSSDRLWLQKGQNSIWKLQLSTTDSPPPTLHQTSWTEHSIPTHPMTAPALGDDGRIWAVYSVSSTPGVVGAMNPTTAVWTFYNLPAHSPFVVPQYIVAVDTTLWVVATTTDSHGSPSAVVCIIDTSGSAVTGWLDPGLAAGTNYVVSNGLARLSGKMWMTATSGASSSWLVGFDISSPTSIPTVVSLSFTAAAAPPFHLSGELYIPVFGPSGHQFEVVTTAGSIVTTVTGPSGTALQIGRAFPEGTSLIWVFQATDVGLGRIQTYDPVGSAWADLTPTFTYGPEPTFTTDWYGCYDGTDFWVIESQSTLTSLVLWNYVGGVASYWFLAPAGWGPIEPYSALLAGTKMWVLAQGGTSIWEIDLP